MDPSPSRMPTADSAASAPAEGGVAGLHGSVQLGTALLDTLDRMGCLVSLKDPMSGRYVHVNTAMAALFSRSPAQVVDRSDAELVETSLGDTWRAADQAALSHAASLPVQQRIELSGQRREFSVFRTELPPAAGVPGGARLLLSVWVESTAEHQREGQLQLALAQLERQQVSAEQQRREWQDQSLRDSATGLYHRLHFDDQLRREVDLSSREHREFALVAIALDPFTGPVAALGEPARRRVLEALGTLLRGNTRAMDASCVLGADRFAILLSGVGLATAHSRMEGLRRQCATQIVVLDGRDLGFTVSMGVASFPHTAHSEVDLLGAAETALVEARRRGGNHVTLASIRFELGA